MAEEPLPYWIRVGVFLRIYFHILPYLALAWLLHWSLFRFEIGVYDIRNPALILAGSLAFGLAASLAEALVVALALSFSSALIFITLTNPSNLKLALAGFLLGLFGSVILSLALKGRSLDTGVIGASAIGVVVLVSALILDPVFCLAFFIGFVRFYYLPIHFLLIQLPPARARLYRFHPVAWDEVCHLPFPGLHRLLVGYVEYQLEAGEREIERLIDVYPSQRPAALRARAILLVRRAAAATDLNRLDEILAGLPAGETGFLRETPELRRHVHEITVLQARLDTLDRPFLREPFAALLVKEIESFQQRIAGFKPALSTELRTAARQWLMVARRQLDLARAANTREPTHQVFHAGRPVNREREAFVPRAAIISEIEQQVVLATGCPGLLIYGRRRMGKSTLLRNLEGLLPQRVRVVILSMQDARAFTSIPDFVTLISQEVAAVLPGASELPADLRGLERFLDSTQKRLDVADRRLLLAIDEYENLDHKIGEGAFSEDLLAVIRESIQTHRRLIWAFAGSHAIDDLVHAAWTSYLVSARTIEVIPFELAETRLLLTEPLKSSSLWRTSGAEPPRFAPGFWGEGGIERIHAEAGGWPHLLQLVAETVVDLVNSVGRVSVDGALLERALDRAVAYDNNTFLELLERESPLPGEWDYLRSFRSAEEQPVPSSEALDRSLRRRRLVIEEAGRYRLRVPLMARWLRQRV
ncbi:MAG TPA: AAA family ATPase [Thermoanaerobaculia bacterium]|nr:AAA family ATPase [Thermoanaerobaculia bacterium]